MILACEAVSETGATPLALEGAVNTDAAALTAQIASAIRRPLPQLWPQPVQPDLVALVGSGPSLASTEHELRDLVWRGAKLVTVNGGYLWCLERNLKPSAQIVLDARPSTARFLRPEVPECRYLVASQCHPDAFEAVEAYPHVLIWHAAVRDDKDPDDPTIRLLDGHYLRQWLQIPGGTTVGTRALFVLHALGYRRLHLFGLDSCWLDEAHHALPQPENAQDRRHRWTFAPADHPDAGRTFLCSPWHVKQAEEFLTILQHHGGAFQLAVHGDGLLAYLLHAAAEGDVTRTQKE